MAYFQKIIYSYTKRGKSSVLYSYGSNIRQNVYCLFWADFWKAQENKFAVKVIDYVKRVV